MVFDRVLAATGDDDDVLNSGGDALLDDVLHQGLVHHGQHFLGLRLGGGEKSSAKPGRRQNRFANTLGVVCHRFGRRGQLTCLSHAMSIHPGYMSGEYLIFSGAESRHDAQEVWVTGRDERVLRYANIKIC